LIGYPGRFTRIIQRGATFETRTLESDIPAFQLSSYPSQRVACLSKINSIFITWSFNTARSGSIVITPDIQFAVLPRNLKTNVKPAKLRGVEQASLGVVFARYPVTTK
jgi:hypothetical protein